MQASSSVTSENKPMFLKQARKPRQSVFNKDRRDVVLDISDLLEGKNDGEDFFELINVYISTNTHHGRF
jgi:hypothetical protein